MINQCRFICFLLVIFLLEGSNSLMAQEALGKINCICIDAGHGGKDPGAISGKLREKDITLAIALKLPLPKREVLAALTIASTLIFVISFLIICNGMKHTPILLINALVY